MSIRWSLHLHVCQSVVCSSSACLHVHFYAYPLVISFSSLSIHKPACPSVKLLSVMLICSSHYLLICPFTVCLSVCQSSFHSSSSLFVHFYVHPLLSSFAALSIHPSVCLVNLFSVHLCLSTCKFVRSLPSVCRTVVSSFICLLVRPFLCSFAGLFICVFGHSSVCPSAPLSVIRLSVHSFVCPSACLSIEMIYVHSSACLHFHFLLLYCFFSSASQSLLQSAHLFLSVWSSLHLSVFTHLPIFLFLCLISFSSSLPVFECLYTQLLITLSVSSLSVCP